MKKNVFNLKKLNSTDGLAHHPFVIRIKGLKSPLIKVKGKKVIFTHILKTAGTSVLNAIDQKFKLHIPASEALRRVGKNEFSEAFKFSFVRNPWSKVFSHYNYNVKTNQQNMKTKKIPFNDWVSCTFGENKDYFYYHRGVHFVDQMSWLVDEDENILVDYIGKFENIDNDFANICKHLKIENKLSHLNKSFKRKTKNYKEYYNKSSIEIVRSVFKRDIKHFGYDF